MERDPLHEVLRRLESLERAVYERDHGHDRGHDHGHDHGHHPDHHEHDRGHHHHDDRGGGGDFEEKRIVDLVVRLVAEKVDHIVERHARRLLEELTARDAPKPPAPKEG